MTRIIGISGRAGSGKTTLAKLLHNMIDDSFVFNFADPIKDVLRITFDWTDEHLYGDLKDVVDPYWGVSPRHAMKTLGTDWGQQMISPDIWIKKAENVLQNTNKKCMIVGDVRFCREAEWITKNGGYILGIINTSEYNFLRLDEFDYTEQEVKQILTRYNSTYHIANNGTDIKPLQSQLRVFMRDYYIGE